MGCGASREEERAIGWDLAMKAVFGFPTYADVCSGRATVARVHPPRNATIDGPDTV